MFGLGMGELIIILVIVLVLVGGRRLPQLASGLGQTVKNFKKALRDDDEREPPREVGPRKDEEQKS